MQCPPPRAVVVTRPIDTDIPSRSIKASPLPRNARRSSTNISSTNQKNDIALKTREFVAMVATTPLTSQKPRTSAPVDIPHRRRASSPPIGTVTLSKPKCTRENNESKSHSMRQRRRHARSHSVPLPSSRSFSLLEPDSHHPILSRNRRDSMPSTSSSSRAFLPTFRSSAAFSSSSTSRRLSSTGTQRSEAKLRPPAFFSFEVGPSPDSSPLLSSSASSANSSPLLSPSRSLSLSGSLFGSQLWSDPNSMTMFGPARTPNGMRASSSPIGPGSSSQAMARSVSASQWSPWGQPTPTSVNSWSPWAESHALFPPSESKLSF